VRVLWFVFLLAGDVNSIIVGAETNIQDHSLVHVGTTSLSGDGSPTVIGDKVTIGMSYVNPFFANPPEGWIIYISFPFLSCMNISSQANAV
jgi:hypothetical protein